MSDQNLRRLCQEFLRRAALADGGTAYGRVKLAGHAYEGLDLLWDGPDRILAIAFCWEPRRLALARKDFLLFMSACGFAGLAKKFHLVLFHAPGTSEVGQDWPVGISVSPIVVDEAGRVEPPQTIAAKLGSLLFRDMPETAAAMQDPPDWRRFLTPVQVEIRIRALAEEKGLPPSLHQETEEILAIANSDPAHLKDHLYDYLTRRWRAGR